VSGCQNETLAGQHQKRIVPRANDSPASDRPQAGDGPEAQGGMIKE